ncbi:MAG: intersectin-EH binding protein Ibp1 [Mycobacterium sp.]
MATSQFPARRLILAGGFVLAVAAAPAVAVFTTPMAGTTAPPIAACTSGEEEDVYTTVCTPMLVPNSPFGTVPGNPDIPTIDGIPCAGRHSGSCIGLAEEAEAAGPPAIPRSIISSSP